MKTNTSPLASERDQRDSPAEKSSSKCEPKVHCAHDRLAEVSTLVDNPRNPNRHPESQIALLAKIIQHQGWRSPVVVSRRSGFVVAGHGCLAAARLLGCATVPVNDQDFATEADEWAHLLADNQLAELSEIDAGALEKILKEMPTAALDFTGFAKVNADAILAKPEDDGGLGSDITDEVPNEREAFIVPVALTRKEWAAWEKKKAELDCKSCKAAFRKLAGL